MVNVFVMKCILYKDVCLDLKFDLELKVARWFNLNCIFRLLFFIL